MIYLSLAFQTMVFLQSILFGIMLGIIYDVLRSIRYIFKTGKYITALCDALFWIITVLSGFVFVLVVAQGNARAYILLGMVLGGLLYAISFSAPVFGALYGVFKLIFTAFARFWKFSKKCIHKENQICMRCLRKINKTRKKTLSFFAKKG